MNFENYNKIYQEILDDDKNELSANYLLNKYEIKHDEELINILNQIKKNEYISSDNTTINKLLEELDEDENLLDINEIIDIKDKVISENLLEDELEEEIESQIKEEQAPKKEEEKVEKREDKKPKIFSNNKITTLNIKYIIIIVALLILLIIVLYISLGKETTEKEIKNEKVGLKTELKEDTKTTENKEIQIEEIKKEELESADQKVKVDDVDSSPLEEDQNLKKEEINEEPNVFNEPEEEVEVDEKLNKVVTYEITTPDLEKKETEIKEEENLANQNSESKKGIENNATSIVLQSVDDIQKYQTQLKYQDGNLVFNNKLYKENDILFGFKIYKLTPLYVKFEDEKRHIRKRILLKQ